MNHEYKELCFYCQGLGELVGDISGNPQAPEYVNQNCPVCGGRGIIIKEAASNSYYKRNAIETAHLAMLKAIRAIEDIVSNEKTHHQGNKPRKPAPPLH